MPFTNGPIKKKNPLPLPTPQKINNIKKIKNNPPIYESFSAPKCPLKFNVISFLSACSCSSSYQANCPINYSLIKRSLEVLIKHIVIINNQVMPSLSYSYLQILIGHTLPLHGCLRTCYLGALGLLEHKTPSAAFAPNVHENP